MNPIPERRYAEIRADGRTLIGVVMPYGAVAELPFGRERFEPGALKGAAEADLILNLQHDRSRPIVRSGNGLIVSELADAVTMRAELPAGPDQDAAIANVQAGILRGLSVEFVAEEERMAADMRIITRARLTGIGLVDRPQYGAATVEARAAVAERMARALARSVAPLASRSRVWVP